MSQPSNSNLSSPTPRCPICRLPASREQLMVHAACVPCTIDAFYLSRAGTPEIDRDEADAGALQGLSLSAQD